MNYAEAMSDHHDFGKLLTTTGKSDNPVWQRVLDGLKDKQRGWRRLDKAIKGCGHPGVRDAGNRCVFCLVERDMARVEQAQTNVTMSRAEHVAHLCTQADNIEKEAKEKAEKLRNEAVAIMSGDAPWPPLRSSRQQAILKGEKWYMSDTACKHCGQHAERYVANGRCRSCGK